MFSHPLRLVLRDWRRNESEGTQLLLKKSVIWPILRLFSWIKCWKKFEEGMQIQCILSFLKYYVIKCLRIKITLISCSQEQSTTVFFALNPDKRGTSSEIHQQHTQLLSIFFFSFRFLFLVIRSPESRVQGPESSLGFSADFILCW